MKILYIWDADYPWDIRVEKICLSLAEAGYEVHILSRNINKWPIREIIGDVVVHRLRPFYSKKINLALSVPLPISPVWLMRIFEIVRDEKIDLIIVRDLPLALNALIASKRFHVPLLFDMAEDYPALLAGVNRVNKSIKNKLFRNPAIAKYIEKIVCRKADCVLVVVEESKNRLVEFGIDPEKIIIVSNTPNLDCFNNDRASVKSENSLQLLYIGGIQMGRGIQNVIKALNILIHQIPNIRFKIIGEGYAKERLSKLVIEQKVEKYVDFIGFVNHEELSSHILESDICLIPHTDNAQTRTTIPNKLFDYMAMEKPVISSDIPPLTRIITEEKCGLVFENNNPEDLAKKVMMLQDKIIRGEYGGNGLMAVTNKYNWGVDFARLLEKIKINESCI